MERVLSIQKVPFEKVNGIMNETQLIIFKKYEIIKPHIYKTVSIIDDSYGKCQYKNFQTFKYRCICYISFTKIGNNEVIK